VVAVSRSRRPTNRKLPLRVATTALHQRKFREFRDLNEPPTIKGAGRKSKSYFFIRIVYIFAKRGGGESVEFPFISFIFVYLSEEISTTEHYYIVISERVHREFILLFVREFIIGGYQNPHQNTII
jgi:hypothetical protein